MRHRKSKQFRGIITLTDKDLYKQLLNLKNNELKGKSWNIVQKKLLESYFIIANSEQKVSSIANKTIENKPSTPQFPKSLLKVKSFLNLKRKDWDKNCQDCPYLLNDFGIVFGPSYEVFYCVESMGEVTLPKIRRHLKHPALCRACQIQKKIKKEEEKTKDLYLLGKISKSGDNENYQHDPFVIRKSVHKMQ